MEGSAQAFRGADVSQVAAILADAMKFSLDTVRAVAQLLDEAQLSEIVVESTDEASLARLLVRRETIVVGADNAPAAPLTEAQIAFETPETAEETAASNRVTVLSPVVGFFLPAPKAVGEGASVKAGQTVGIIKSVGVPNEVAAPVAGRVVELLVQEGEGVEYQHSLMVIEPEA